MYFTGDVFGLGFLTDIRPAFDFKYEKEPKKKKTKKARFARFTAYISTFLGI